MRAIKRLQPFVSSRCVELVPPVSAFESLGGAGSKVDVLIVIVLHTSKPRETCRWLTLLLTNTFQSGLASSPSASLPPAGTHQSHVKTSTAPC